MFASGISFGSPSTCEEKEKGGEQQEEGTTERDRKREREGIGELERKVRISSCSILFQEVAKETDALRDVRACALCDVGGQEYVVTKRERKTNRHSFR